MPIVRPDRAAGMPQRGQWNEIEVAGVPVTLFKDRQYRHML
jgi:hypothetical protein